MTTSVQRSSKVKIFIAFGAGLAFFLLNGALAYTMIVRLIQNERLVSHTHEVISELDETLASLTAAETGQRGLIITDDRSYLQPYQTHVREVSEHVTRLRILLSDNQ